MIEKSDLKIKRSWIGKSYEIEYQASIKLPSMSLPILSDHLINQVLPSELLTAASTLDLKGANNTIKQSVEISSSKDLAQQRPVYDREELLYLKGDVLVDLDTQQYEPFQIIRASNFDSFKGQHHIIHSLETKHFGALDTTFTLSEVPLLFPIVLNKLKIGLELFSSQRTFIIGFAPEVTQSLLLEADQTSCLINIRAERLYAKTSLPLERYSLFNKLDLALKQLTGWSLIEDYTKLLAN